MVAVEDINFHPPHTVMSELPDFSKHGYQVVRELGHNSCGGRVTYLATRTSLTNSHPEGFLAVIKQFQFARAGSNWSDCQSYQREIQILQQLNHPSIPPYLDSFETPTGFCLVPEYKQAPSLGQLRQWTPEEIQQIAAAVLEVLVYLQQQVTQDIPRDIKPENILVDRPAQGLPGRFWAGSLWRWGSGSQQRGERHIRIYAAGAAFQPAADRSLRPLQSWRNADLFAERDEIQ